MFFFVPVAGNPTVPASPIERINFGGKNYVIEMPSHNRQASEHRLVIVDVQCYIYGPTRQKARHVQLEPDHQPTHTHDDRAPDDSPIFHFFRVAKPANGRFAM